MSSELVLVEELLHRGDLILVQDGNHGGNYPKVEEFCDTGVPLITGACIDAGQIAFASAGFITKERAAKLRVGFAKAGDVLLTHKGTMGKTALVQNSIYPFFVLNPQITLYRVKPDGCLRAKYLKYYFDSRFFQDYLIRISSTSTISTLPIKEQKKLSIPIPAIETQDSICSVLGSLDDRITLLRETNATLEAIAQALFKSWFVDFDPVRAKMEGRIPEGMDEDTARLFPDELEESELGLVPRGWRVLPIGDAVEAVGGATPDTKTPEFWEPAIHCWTTPKDLSGIAAPVLLNTERKLSDQGLAKIGSGALPIGTLLLSSRAPIGYLALAQVPLAINQGYIAMLPGGLLPPLFLLFWCRQNMEVIKGRANGSTFMEISKKAFRPIPALVPTPPIVQAFAAVAGALFDRLIENEKQAQTLATLRDTLLPRLISGQICMPRAF
jgi:type I restriction enzyme S subunit